MKGLVIPMLLLLILTGCWSKNELNEWGFVNAVAIDKDAGGNFILTTQLYKPGTGDMSSDVQEAGSLTITSKAKSLDEAAQDISIHLGKRAQWSHMSIILISDQNIKEKSVKEIVEYFLRDPESRETSLVALTKGKAQDYLVKAKPFMNNTLGQQFRSMALLTEKKTGKTHTATLLQFAIQLKNESGISLLPVLYKQEDKLEQESISGLAIFKDGYLVSEQFNPGEVQNIFILRNQYHTGVKEINCGSSPSVESIQIQKTKTTIEVVPNHQTVKLKIRVQLVGALGKFFCSPIDSELQEKQAVERVHRHIEEALTATVKDMQRKKLDLLNIGDQVYRKDPVKWRGWKGTWDQRFQTAEVDLKVNIEFSNALGQKLLPKPIIGDKEDG
ncbi:Ger(x)C family spore germination protein [Paenibacillus sepulcri]|uniref:Ger(X)C family spore germination protein n=1 Tax=Paenibacillus sepulcri TaxID=359917 RepID=A0ABS7BZP9_9BACL|nr:Ger(x)C family spore germination protein [Paenibacillus sepulcri]